MHSTDDTSGALRSLSALREAVLAAPQAPGPRHALGAALLEAGRFSEAVDVYGDLMDLMPSDPACRLGRARARHGAGDLAGAEADFRGVQRQDKTSFDAAMGLARVRRERGDLAGARAAIGSALRLAPDSLEARVLLGFIQLERGEATAENTFRNVLWNHPRQPEARAGLARMGRPGALDITTTDDSAELLLARAEAAQTPRERGALIRELRSAVEQRRPATELARLFAALGDLYDAEGDNQQAMLCWAAGNRRMGGRYDAAAHARKVDALRDVFSAERVAQRRPAGPAGGPLLVVGLPGSGAGLVRRLLAGHGDIAAARAQSPLHRIARDLPRFAASAWPDCVEALDRVGGHRLGARWQLDLEQKAGRARMVMDASPLQLEHVGLAALLAPGARVVVVDRDPLDMALSAFRRPLRGDGAAQTRDLGDIAAAMDVDRGLLAHWRSVLPVAFHTVRYESLVQRPEATLSALWRFAGVRNAAPCEPLRADRVGVWYRYARWLAPLAPARAA